MKKRDEATPVVHAIPHRVIPYGVIPYAMYLMYFLIMLILIITVSKPTTASTADVSLFINGKPLTTIAYYHQYITTAHVVIETDINVSSIGFVKADFSDLTQGSIQQKRSLSCAKNMIENKLNCTTSNIKVYLKTKNTANINISIANSTYQENITTTITFSVDSQKPIVTFVGTDTCKQKCYYKPGQTTLVAQIQDDNPLRQANIYIRVDGLDKVKTTTCDNGYCTALKDMPSCSQGEAISIAVVNPSRDDAGNQVDYSKGNASNTLYCDNKAPSITNFNITSDYSVAENIFAEGSSITIDVNGSDYSPVFIDVNFSAVGGSFVSQECSKSGRNFECSVSSTIISGAGRTVTIPITVRDITGNQVKLDRNIEISTVVSTTPRLWNLNPNSIDIKVPANYLEYSSYLTYAYTSLSTQTNAEIIHIDPGACILDNGTGATPEMSVQRFNNRLLIGFNFDVGSVGEQQIYDYGINKYNCAIAIYSKLGNKVYEHPEIKNITLRVNFYYTTDPAKSLQKEINNTESRINKFEKTSFGKLYSGIIQLYKLEPLCKIGYGITGVQNILNSVQFSLAITSTLFPPLEAAAATVQRTKESLRFDSGYKILNNPLTTAYCKILACNLVNVSKVIEKTGLKSVMDEYPRDVGKWLGYNSVDQMLDPYDNYASAVLQLCPGAMAYHIAQYKSIDCSYLLCLDTAKNTGISPEYCRSMRNVERCRFWWGGLKVIPWVKLENDFVQVAKQAILNPIASILAITNYAVCKFIPETKSNAVCYIPVLLSELDKTWHLFKDIIHFNWYQGKGAIETGQKVCDEIAAYINKGESRRALDNYGIDSTQYFFQYNKVLYQHLLSIKDPECGKVYLKPTDQPGQFEAITPGTNYQNSNSQGCKGNIYTYELHKNEIAMEEVPITLDIEGLKKSGMGYKELKQALEEKRTAIIEKLRAEGISNSTLNELKQALENVEKKYREIKKAEDKYNKICAGKKDRKIDGMTCDEYKKKVLGKAQKEYRKAKAHVYSVMIKILSEAYWNNPASLINSFKFYVDVIHSPITKKVFGMFGIKIKPSPGKTLVEIARNIEKFGFDELVSQKLCSGRFEKQIAITGNVNVFKIPVAWINGVKSEIVNVTSSGELKVIGYNYLITGKVVNNKNVSLDFEVYLKGDGKLLINDTRVKNGEYPSQGNLIFMGNSSRSYNLVCIKFKQANFYEILDTSPWISNELCNRIVEVD